MSSASLWTRLFLTGWVVLVGWWFGGDVTGWNTSSDNSTVVNWTMIVLFGAAVLLIFVSALGMIWTF